MRRAADEIERLTCAKPPWADLANHDRDGPWADYSAWKSWLLSQMPEYAQNAWDELGDDGAWQENVYAVWCGPWDEIERLAKWRHDTETATLAASVIMATDRRRAEKAEAENARLWEALRLACTPPWPAWDRSVDDCIASLKMSCIHEAEAALAAEVKKGAGNVSLE